MENSQNKPEAILQAFLHTLQPRYLLVDAARNPQILTQLHVQRCRFHSLFSDQRAQTMAEYAPYLVEDHGQNAFLELFAAHWGKHWGCCITASVENTVLVKHLRDILWAKTPDGPMLFRFYDPRVIHRILPALDQDHAKRLFGPIEAFYTESVDLPDQPVQTQQVHRFVATPQGVQEDVASFEQLTNYLNPATA